MKIAREAGLCMALLASALTPAAAAEHDAQPHARAVADGTTRDGSFERMKPERHGVAAKGCGDTANRADGAVPAAAYSGFQKLVCWWRDGLSRQSRAPIP